MAAMKPKFIVLALALASTATAFQSPEIQAIKIRLRDLQPHEVEVTLTDGPTLRGRILRMDEDAFTLQQQKPLREYSLPYSRVKNIAKSGLSRRAKAILIPAAIGGGVLLVFCAAPYPIGFLCRKDPS
jgi:hypothetical protein